MITSSSNARVKNIIALQKKPGERKEQGLFVVEGRKLVGEAPAGWISEVYLSESYAADMSSDGKHLEMAEISCEILSDEVFAKVSDTRTPQGILALVRMPSYDFSDLMGNCHRNPPSESGYRAQDPSFVQMDESRQEQPQPLLLVLEDIQDPGNLGTILRTAEGAGVTGIIMSRGTVDIYNPKVVRSTMGSIYRVPFLAVNDLGDAIRQVKAEDVKLYAAHLKGSSIYDAFDYRQACGFMIGNEANGLSDETTALADAYVRIPMCGRVESLNAAVSAALLSYEAGRQRRQEW